MANALLALLVSIPLLVQAHAPLVLKDALSVLPIATARNVSPTFTEVALVLPVMLVNSPLLDQLHLMLALLVTMKTVKLVQVMQLENVLCVTKALLCQAENAQNVVIPTVKSALLLELENATPVLPVIT